MDTISKLLQSESQDNTQKYINELYIPTKGYISSYIEVHNYINNNIYDLGTSAENFFDKSWFLEKVIATIEKDGFNGNANEGMEHGDPHFHIKIQGSKQDLLIFLPIEIPQSYKDIKRKDGPELTSKLQKLIYKWAIKTYTGEKNKIQVPIKGEKKTNWEATQESWVLAMLNSKENYNAENLIPTINKINKCLKFKDTYKMTKEDINVFFKHNYKFK